ncbi:guanosine-3',5'-bis(diphosphate) 3'-pyrophosphohydrolase MESH1 [Rhizophagus clarus]|uniref:Guanosine-3',5'-bis(diphosphate) 3'-pyrophosphohydrolase MESH1 n=1 Tax=Rhizophagus clarus TaxID=94130 RepID=A0A8H3QU21_9GLOM|nr:guanosine-3',5'-bis(diphosphate) 3'-pyrophosphohydrolase MESH1 [Rhizophagus clarus]
MSSQGTQVSNASFDIVKLIDTIDFAARKHSFQRRKDSAKTPYINHPIGVAKNLTDAGVYDLVTIQAAILHDTVEDTKTTFEEIEQNFGREVKNIVAECTDDKTLEKEEIKRLQIEHTPHLSKQAKEVKLADKLYNLKDIKRDVPTGWSKERVQEYYIWAKKVTDGARGINQKLEEQLDEIYANGIFVLQGEEYKCHP